MNSDRDRRELDLKDEIAFHLAEETERRVAAGQPLDQARAAARRAFGNVSLVEDVTRHMWGPTMMRERLLHDIRFAARLLVRDPSFTVVALTTLSLGIAATITVFAVVKAVLLNPLPFPDPERLVLVWERTPSGDQRNYASAFNVGHWLMRNQSFEQLGAVAPMPVNLTGFGDADQVDGLSVMGGFFEALGTRPLLGRTMTARDVPGVAVISHRLWQQRFASDPSAIGRVVTFNGNPTEIIGVMPPGFAFPAARDVQVYAPMPPEASTRPGGRSMTTVARLKQGVTLESARADMHRVVAQLIAEGTPNLARGWSASVFPLFDEVVTSVKRVLWVVLASVSCLLLLACANVANLLIIRNVKRAPELALRLALGAGRWRIVHQLSTESVLLAAGAGVIGLAFAFVIVPAIPALFPDSFPLPRGSEVAVDRSIVLFTLLLAATIALLFSVLPMLRVIGERFGEVLRSGGRTALAAHTRLRRSMVVVEVAIALVLVLGAALMARSLVALYAVDPGFRPEQVLTLRMLMLPSKYLAPPARVSFLSSVLDEVRATPGIVSASSVHFLPLSGIGSGAPVYRADRPQPPREQMRGGPVSVVADGYFKAMGIPLVGRDFDSTDGLTTPTVVIVNRALARQLFPNENPIGKRIAAGYSPRTRSMEVVGVAGDVRTSTLDREAGPAIYIAHSQEPSMFASLVVRTQGSPARAVDAVRKAIARADPDQGVAQVQPMETLMANATARPRVQASVFAMFGGLALIIAAVGLYGVMAYGVEQRRREIGLQLALGASPTTVLRAVVREGVLLAVIGTAVGAALAWMASGALDGLLYDTRPTDPVMFVTASATLIAVACLATLAPAFRATRVDPLVVLREE